MKRMTPEECRAFILSKLNPGDDLERATLVFKNMSEFDLDQLWFSTGQTAREVWQGYRDTRKKFEQSIEWLKGIQIQERP